MTAKVRISYEKPQELHTVLKMLNPIVNRIRQKKAGVGGLRRHIWM